MFIQILQLVLVLALFFPIKWLCWKITEVWGLPTFLDYMPWVCRKCLSFWSLISIYIAIGLVFQLYITLGVGVLLTILDTIAVIVDQKKKTIKI